MALVAYDDSSSSEIEDEEPPTHVLNNDKEEKLLNNISSSASVLAGVPAPTRARAAFPREEEDEFLRKRERARIPVPAPIQFKDVETSRAKPRTAANSKSGLLSLLPQPKHSAPTTLIPRSVTNEPAAKPAKPSAPLIPRVLTTAPPVLATVSPPASPPHDNDFFSIARPPDRFSPPPLETDATVIAPAHISLLPPQNTDMPSVFNSLPVSEEPMEETGGGSGRHDDVLDEEAILALCGSRAKRRREQAVVVEAVAGTWDPTPAAPAQEVSRPAPQPRRGEGPTSQQKRKHHITYLAHQAKANEAELQNHWASGRQNKRQAHAKYGF